MPVKKTNSKKTETIHRSTTFSRIKKSVPIRYRNIKARVRALMERRPHRSFRMTRRRDYVRQLQLPGYWALTNEVRKLLIKNRKLFVALALFYGFTSALLVGFVSQNNYSELSDTVRELSDQFISGDFGELGNAAVVLTNIVTGTLNTNLTEAQRLFAAILGLLVWLTTVWLLRAILAGKRPRLRDGLYNAGAPIVPTFALALTLLLQLLPVALAVAGYSAATATGLLNSGVEAMIFWTAASLLGLLSLYWISSTFFALIIVTLPGMYPMEALRTAGDLVIGRRVRILLRLLWLVVTIALFWLIVMLPVILLDAWIKGAWVTIDWIPIVPVVLLIMGTATVVWSASYVYILYRKVVDDDATSA
jgi:hypothetical protein